MQDFRPCFWLWDLEVRICARYRNLYSAALLFYRLVGFACKLAFGEAAMGKECCEMPRGPHIRRCRQQRSMRKANVQHASDGACSLCTVIPGGAVSLSLCKTCLTVAQAASYSLQIVGQSLAPSRLQTGAAMIRPTET